jgi:asparaginyl-tRNA synthetase
MNPVRPYNADTSVRPPSSWRNPDDHLARLLDSPWYRLLHRVTETVMRETWLFFDTGHYHYLPVPITTTSISSPMGAGSDSKPVMAQINGGQVYLADSLQFLLELGVRIGGGSAWYVSNSFRGENVDATHLSEFSHAEVEIIGDLDDVVALGSRYVTHLARGVLRHNHDDVIAAAGSARHVQAVADLNGEFLQVRFDEALKNFGDRLDLSSEVLPGVRCLTRAGERALLDAYGEPIWVTHMPAMACPFYQRPEPGTDACLSADLLLGPGEVLGAGARCIDAESTLESLARHEVALENYGWYVDMKRRSPIKTAGFGLGIERFIMWILHADDIRDCTFWQRSHGCVVEP